MRASLIYYAFVRFDAEEIPLIPLASRIGMQDERRGADAPFFCRFDQIEIPTPAWLLEVGC